MAECRSSLKPTGDGQREQGINDTGTSKLYSTTASKVSALQRVIGARHVLRVDVIEEERSARPETGICVARASTRN